MSQEALPECPRHWQLLAYGRLCDVLKKHSVDEAASREILEAAREYAAAEYELGRALGAAPGGPQRRIG